MQMHLKEKQVEKGAWQEREGELRNRDEHTEINRQESERETEKKQTV